MENKLKTVDAETLLSTPMSKTVFIVDNLIPQGVNVISGASKIGKSWLMLWLGLRVAQGLPVWGLTTQQCDVLYLSLEDTQRRIKDRLYILPVLFQNFWRNTDCAVCAFTIFGIAVHHYCLRTAYR